jgi:bacteriocin biosynthesis cyclodehydratase domain-containing protein
MKTESSAKIPENPCIKPWYRIVESDGATVLQYGSHALRFQGAGIKVLFPLLVPLLDGTRPRAEILAMFEPKAGEAVTKALTLLAENELLLEGRMTGELPRQVSETLQFATANAFFPTASAISGEELLAAEIVLIGTGDTAKAVRREFMLAGLRCDCAEVEEVVARKILNPHLLAVVAPSLAEMPDTDRINRRLYDENVPWLYVSPHNGHFSAVGPLFIPRETGCFHCFLLRQSVNQPFSGEFMKLANSPAGFPQPSFVTNLSASIAATFVIQWLLMRNIKVAGQFYHIEYKGGLKVGSSHFHKVPRCPVCSRVSAYATPSLWAES